MRFISGVIVPLTSHENRRQILHSLKATPPDQGLVVQALMLPDRDLLTKTSPVVARPFEAGVSRTYKQRHHEARMHFFAREIVYLTAAMVGSAVIQNVCASAAPLLGAKLVPTRAALNAILVFAYAYISLRQRIEVQALGGARLLADGHEAMAYANANESMANVFLDIGNKALEHARVLGMVDPRLAPAARQYAERYNEIFGASEVLRIQS